MDCSHLGEWGYNPIYSHSLMGLIMTIRSKLQKTFTSQQNAILYLKGLLQEFRGDGATKISNETWAVEDDQVTLLIVVEGLSITLVYKKDNSGDWNSVAPEFLMGDILLSGWK